MASGKRKHVLLIAFLVGATAFGIYWIVKPPPDPDRWVENGKRGRFTPLMVAARKGDLDEIQYQLELGASIDKEGMAGRTPLEIAIWYGQYPAAQLLLESGADPNHRRDLTHVDDGPLRMTIERIGGSSGANYQLFLALLDAGADPMFEDGELLYLAADLNQADFLDALLAAMKTETAREQAEYLYRGRHGFKDGLDPTVLEIIERYR